MDFSSKKVLITGASSGIGKELALEFHSKGADILLVARRRELLEQLTNDFNSLRSNSAEFFVTDLVNEDSLAELCKVFESRQVDILITNAGRGSFGYFHELDLAQEIELVRLNINSSMMLAHRFLEHLDKRVNSGNLSRGTSKGAQKSVGIINLSSIAGFQPLPFMATYAATKAFNLFHSYALSYELEEKGISVLSVCPGPVETEFFGVARVEGSMTGVQRDSAKQVAKDIVEAFKNGRKLVFPGKRGFWLSMLQRITPLFISTYLVKRVLKPILEESRKN